MSITLEQVIDSLCRNAQWEQPLPDTQGGYFFSLENDMELHIIAPNDTLCILWGPVVTLSKNDHERMMLLRMLAAASIGAYHKRQSVLSLHDATVSLHRKLLMDESLMTDIALQAQGLLNDLAWWQQYSSHVN